MEAVLPYLIRSVCISGLLAAYYAGFLRNTNMHRFNRFYLIAAFLLSMGIPLIAYNGNGQVPFNITGFSRLPELPAANNLGGAAPFPVLLGIGTAVAALLTLLLVWHIARIVWLKKTGTLKTIHGIAVIETADSGAPFSFFGWLFWKKGLVPDDAVTAKILAHESAHIRYRHSYDRVGSQFICCVCWMNPFLWFFHRELTLVHEYMADEACLCEGDTQGLAQMLLGSYDHGRYLQPVQYLNQSPVQRRLRMLLKKRNERGGLSRQLFVFPLCLLLLTFSNCRLTRGQEIINRKLKQEQFLRQQTAAAADSSLIYEKLNLLKKNGVSAR